jgi:hypothetical protein
VWNPYTLHSPIILHLNLLKAAIVQSHVQPDESNFEKAFLYHPPPNTPPVDPVAILKLRVRAISMLNARLRSPRHAMDDKSIGSVLYLIYLEVINIILAPTSTSVADRHDGSGAGAKIRTSLASCHMSKGYKKC